LTNAEAIAYEKNKKLFEGKQKLNTALNSQKTIQDEGNKCKYKIKSATTLIEGLEGKRKRWTQQLAGFNMEIKNSLGNIVLLTCFLSYSGPFNQEYRTYLMQS
jgi:dynein heavy chain